MVTFSRKQRIAAGGASLALVAAIMSAGAMSTSVSAQTALTGSGPSIVRQEAPPAPKPQPKPGRENRGENRGQGRQGFEQQRQAYLDALAGRLGLTRDQLGEAMKAARIDTINKAVADGKLDQERANRMIQAIQSGQRGPGQGQQNQPGQNNQRGQRPGPGQRPGQGQQNPGMAGWQQVASILGMSPQDLTAELRSGKSLAQVAEAKGISRETLKAKLLEQRKAQLDQAVASGRLTADQAKARMDQMTANIDRMLDATPGQRRPMRNQNPGA